MGLHATTNQTKTHPCPGHTEEEAGFSSRYVALDASPRGAPGCYAMAVGSTDASIRIFHYDDRRLQPQPQAQPPTAMTLAPTTAGLPSSSFERCGTTMALSSRFNSCRGRTDRCSLRGLPMAWFLFGASKTSCNKLPQTPRCSVSQPFALDHHPNRTGRARSRLGRRPFWRCVATNRVSTPWISSATINAQMSATLPREAPSHSDTSFKTQPSVFFVLGLEVMTNQSRCPRLNFHPRLPSQSS